MDIINALIYEINKVSNFSLYIPETDEVNKYTDFVKRFNYDNENPIIYSLELKDGWFFYGTNIIDGITTFEIDKLTSTYAEIDNIDDYYIFGLKFLPYNIPYYDEKIKKYIVKIDPKTNKVINRNPLYSDNFYTILKILIPTLIIILVAKKL